MTRQTKNSFKKILKKSVPVYLVALLFINTTGVAYMVQYYLFKQQINQIWAVIGDTPEQKAERLQTLLFPSEGVNLGIKWGDLGVKLVEIGVIDEEKFLATSRSASNNDFYSQVLSGYTDEYIIVDENNAHFVLNMFWAFGLALESPVLNEGIMSEYEEVGNFASTGGWTLGKENAMNYYGKHKMLDLNKDQHDMVNRIASGIFRPCCGNHTAFPDCNHGMAMLGLIQLMVANGYSEAKIYDLALKINTYWFPDTYITIAQYMEEFRDTSWEDVNPQEMLGNNFSSAAGYSSISSQVKPLPSSGGGGGCGV
jgi:hypothetical protein